MNKNTVTINNIKYLIKNKNDLIQGHLFKGHQWNNDLVLIIGLLIKKYNLKHFVNVGCHIGTVALPISKYIERVTAIEAFTPTYQHFLEHIRLNNIKNIKPLNLALGDKETKVFFLDLDNEKIKNNSGGMHAITEEDIKKNRLSANFHSKKYENYMKRLDDLPIDRFDIMLLDVEGKEYETIKGSSKKITKNKPIIISEIWGDEKRKLENMSMTREDVISYLKTLNYKLIKKFQDDHIFFHEDFKIDI